MVNRGSNFVYKHSYYLSWFGSDLTVWINICIKLKTLVHTNWVSKRPCSVGSIGSVLPVHCLTFIIKTGLFVPVPSVSLFYFKTDNRIWKFKNCIFLICNSGITERESNDTNINIQHQRTVEFSKKINHWKVLHSNWIKTRFLCGGGVVGGGVVSGRACWVLDYIHDNFMIVYQPSTHKKYITLIKQTLG